MESSISTLKYGVEKISKECQVEFKELETKNTQLHETVTKVRRDMKTSKMFISEIEKSLAVFLQQEDFMRPAKTVKPTVNDEASSSTLTLNMFAELVQDNTDPEITFRNVASSDCSHIIITEEVNEQPPLNGTKDMQGNDELSQINGASSASREGEEAKESPTIEQNKNESKNDYCVYWH